LVTKEGPRSGGSTGCEEARREGAAAPKAEPAKLNKATHSYKFK
jgi:hypothetical protein